MATFGYSGSSDSFGTTSTSIFDGILVASAVPAGPFTATKITASLRTSSGNATAQAGLYDSTGALVAHSDTVTISNTNAQLIDFAIDCIVTNQNYYIVFIASSNLVIDFLTTNPSSPEQQSTGKTFGTWPSTATFTQSGLRKYVIYVTYQSTPTRFITASEQITVADKNLVTRPINANTKNVVFFPDSIAANDSSPVLSRGTQPFSIRFALLVASDYGTLSTTIISNLQALANEIQTFYYNQLANGKTFLLNPPDVDIIYSTRASSYFDDTPSPSSGLPALYDYYINVFRDYQAMTGNSENSTTNRYVIFPLTPGTSAAGFLGATMPHTAPAPSGNGAVCVLNNCVGTIDITSAIARGITAHELGHSFGLNHSSPDDGTLMDALIPAVWPINFSASHLSLLRSNTFFQTFVTLTPLSRSVSDAVTINESITLIQTTPTGQLSVFAQQTITVSDSDIVLGKISLQVSEIISLAELGQDSGLDSFLDVIFIINQSISVSDTIPITDFLPSRAELIFMQEDVEMFMPPPPDENIDVFQTLIRGVKIISP